MSLVTGDGPNLAPASVSLQKMLGVMREIKQAARRILAWVFDNWMEVHGHKERTFRSLFRELDLSDAVDLKRLLIELYDRRRISRASLQMKMDLDAEIEAANRNTESQKIDLFEEISVKSVMDMVVAGIMTIDAAQEMLGIDPPKSPSPATTEASWSEALVFYSANRLI